MSQKTPESHSEAPAVPPSAPATIGATLALEKPQVMWTPLDKKQLLNYLKDHKAQARDGGMFKDTVWHGMATILNAQRAEDIQEGTYKPKRNDRNFDIPGEYKIMYIYACL